MKKTGYKAAIVLVLVVILIAGMAFAGSGGRGRGRGNGSGWGRGTAAGPEYRDSWIRGLPGRGNAGPDVGPRGRGRGIEQRPDVPDRFNWYGRPYSICPRCGARCPGAGRGLGFNPGRGQGIRPGRGSGTQFGRGQGLSLGRGRRQGLGRGFGFGLGPGQGRGPAGSWEFRSGPRSGFGPDRGPISPFNRGARPQRPRPRGMERPDNDMNPLPVPPQHINPDDRPMPPRWRDWGPRRGQEQDPQEGPNAGEAPPETETEGQKQAQESTSE